MHKLKPQHIAQAEDFLQRAFSDDVSVNAFLPMVEAEDDTPTFNHLHNWNELSDQDKADLIVINNMIKLICIADFSSHYFKEVSSLSKIVEQVLNNDSRLDINAPKEDRPSLDNVLKEI